MYKRTQSLYNTAENQAYKEVAVQNSKKTWFEPYQIATLCVFERKKKNRSANILVKLIKRGCQMTDDKNGITQGQPWQEKKKQNTYPSQQFGKPKQITASHLLWWITWLRQFSTLCKLFSCWTRLKGSKLVLLVAWNKCSTNTTAVLKVGENTRIILKEKSRFVVLNTFSGRCYQEKNLSSTHVLADCPCSFFLVSWCHWHKAASQLDNNHCWILCSYLHQKAHKSTLITDTF